MEDLDELIEKESQSGSGVAIAVKELTNVQKDKDDSKLSNVDFKTRLTLPEIRSQCCLEWLNDVFQEKEKFKTELRVVELINRLKRLRVSEQGKSREGLQNIFIAEKQEERTGLKNFFQPRNRDI